MLMMNSGRYSRKMPKQYWSEITRRLVKEQRVYRFYTALIRFKRRSLFGIVEAGIIEARIAEGIETAWHKLAY